MKRKTPSLILHIGQHKTGSKALQSFLAHNRHALRDQGILYPVETGSCHGIRAYAISQFRLFALVRREALAACLGRDAAELYWEQQRPYCRPYESVYSLLEAVEVEQRRTGPRHVILSAEDLFDMHTAHEIDFSFELVAAGANLLAKTARDLGYDPRVVVYLRRQDHLLGAHYVQFIKGSPVHDIGFTEFARAFAPRLDSQLILAQWVQAFGPDRVTVRPYERVALPAGIVPDFFEHVLGTSVPAACEEPPGDAESINRTLDRDFVEFIRILNRRYAASRSVFARDMVLEAALRSGTSTELMPGIAGWLSPAERRGLLDAHSQGNARIARDFLSRHDGRLFAERPPVDDGSWRPYVGLSPEQATDLAIAIHETILSRHLPDPNHVRGSSPAAVPALSSLSSPERPVADDQPHFGTRILQKLRAALVRRGRVNSVAYRRSGEQHTRERELRIRGQVE